MVFCSPRTSSQCQIDLVGLFGIFQWKLRDAQTMEDTDGQTQRERTKNIATWTVVNKGSAVCVYRFYVFIVLCDVMLRYDAHTYTLCIGNMYMNICIYIYVCIHRKKYYVYDPLLLNRMRTTHPRGYEFPQQMLILTT